MPRATGEHRREVYIRTFRCPDCGMKMYAHKRGNHKTKPGHKKLLWCPWCKAEKNMVQVE